MTPNQIKLVQTSFAQVAPIAATAADLFYGRLFEIAPQVRAMFPDDLSEQKKKLMAMLGTAVAGLNHLETLMPAVQALGRRHGGYGVKAQHYASVGSALDERGQRKAYGGVTPPRAASSNAFRAVAAASTASSTLVEAAVSITYSTAPLSTISAPQT